MKLFASLAFAATFAFAGTAFANEAVPAPKVDIAAGEATYTAVCAACHGADGNAASPEYPRLAGQHPEYMTKQLHEFKSGKRANAIMSGFSAMLSDADIGRYRRISHRRLGRAGDALQGAVKAGRVTGCEQLLRVGLRSAGAAHLDRKCQVEIENAVTAAGVALASVAGGGG